MEINLLSEKACLWNTDIQDKSGFLIYKEIIMFVNKEMIIFEGEIIRIS